MSSADVSRAGSAATQTAAFFAEVEAHFSRASRAAGIVVRDLQLAGYRLRLRFAGTALVRPLTRALAHLEVPEEGEPDMTLDLWDVASTGVGLPPARWGREAYGVRSQIDGYNDEDYHTVFQAWTQSLLLYEVRRSHGFYCTDDARELPSFETAAALRTHVHWWARSRGMQMVHGAAVVGAQGCVLLAGDSGAGKSSTALACLSSNLGYLSDDYSLLELGDPPRLHCVYGVGKVAIADIARMPFLRPLVSNEWELGREKGVVYVNEHMPERLVSSAPLRAIVLPQLCERRDSAIEPISPAAALVALGAFTHVQLPNAGEEILRRLLPLVRATPCFRLALGSDVSQLAGLLAGVLERVGPVPEA